MGETNAVQTVAVVLFEGFTVLDVYGPVQAFASCRVPSEDGGFRRLFQLYSLAEKAGQVNSGEGPPSYAEYSFDHAPDCDILLIPGGFGTRAMVNDTSFLDHLSAASRRATVTATVCTGSALLARTGLLDGRPATSNKIAWDWVVQQRPQVQWRRQARWVDDGTIIRDPLMSQWKIMLLPCRFSIATLSCATWQPFNCRSHHHRCPCCHRPRRRTRRHRHI